MTTVTTNQNGAFDVFNTIAEIIRPDVKFYECSRMGLGTPLYINGKKETILEPNMRVCVQDEKLVNGEATHFIKRISGRPGLGKFELLIMDINTFELSFIFLLNSLD